MKKLIIGTILFLFAMPLFSQQGKYVINGHISGNYNANKVYLVEEEFINGPQTVIDSSYVENGNFKFEGKTPDFVKMYFVQSADPNSRTNLTPVFLEEGTIRINISAEHFTHNCKVNGTINNELLTFYFLQDRYITDSIMAATNIDWAINGWDQEREQTEFPRRTKLIKKRWLDIQKNMVTLYNKQVFAPFMIYWEMRRDMTPEQLTELKNQLDPSLANHPYTLALSDYIASTGFGIGNQMPNFSLPDQFGQTVEWKEFSGKYVLIDFWASWCAPCIRELPNIKKLYEECKDMNFEIVGVSLDRDKEKWINAIKEHGMPWPQLCDFKVWDTQPAKLCNVDAVPFTILVDPKGNVIAVNLRGEELANKVKELIEK